MLGCSQLQNSLIYLVSIILLVGVLAVMLYLTYRKNNADKKSKGKTNGRSDHSDKVVAAMRSFARSNRFRFIAPATIKSNGMEAKLDALVVGYFGVLGVISLGYNGEIYGEANEETWVQVNDGDKRNRFPNPIDETSQAVRTVRDVLFAAKLKKVPVEIMYVFANPSAQLALPRSIAPLTLKSFKSTLNQQKYLDDSGLDMDKVEQALQAAVVSLADK